MAATGRLHLGVMLSGWVRNYMVSKVWKAPTSIHQSSWERNGGYIIAVYCSISEAVSYYQSTKQNAICQWYIKKLTKRVQVV